MGEDADAACGEVHGRLLFEPLLDGKGASFRERHTRGPGLPAFVGVSMNLYDRATGHQQFTAQTLQDLLRAGREYVALPWSK